MQRFSNILNFFNIANKGRTFIVFSVGTILNVILVGFLFYKGVQTDCNMQSLVGIFREWGNVQLWLSVIYAGKSAMENYAQAKIANQKSPNGNIPENSPHDSGDVARIIGDPE